MIWFIAYVSYFLDGIFSALLPTYGFFRPLFSLLSLLLMYPFCYYQKKNYFILSFCLGMLYDFTYTNTPFFHGLLFLLFAFLIQLWNHYYRNTIWNLVCVSTLLILGYRIFGYLLLVFLQSYPFNGKAFLRILGSSFLLNWLYIAIFFPFVLWLARKKHIHIMN